MIRHLPLFLALWAPGVLAASPEAPEPGALSRLAAGEVILEKVHSDESGGAVRARIRVWAPVQAVWSVIVSCDYAFAFVEGLEHCEVLEERGDYAITHQVVKKWFPVPAQEFSFETRRVPHERMDFSLLEGNLKAMEGSWKFDETDDGIIIDYDFRLRPGVPAPAFMVRRSLQKSMPDMLACIRGLAGGSADGERERTDLDRCPGKVRENPESTRAPG